MKLKFIYIISLIIILPTSAQKPYFQQEVNYKIQVSLDDCKHFLHAYETIEYTNNSPDELFYLYFHLWPNGYKNNETAFAKQKFNDGSTKFYNAKDKDRGYIDSLEFKIDNKDVKWEYDPVNIDICKILLNEPLKPGATITISTPFRVKIPGDFSRMGHVGQSYQITQWYPKPAVYDRDGWHAMPYLDLGEFYSEYGSFDVEITLPANYVVGATGNLQNAEEREWLDKKADETLAKEVFESDSLVAPVSASVTKTLRYTERNIHDFAWFADKRYNVLKDSLILPSGKKVTTWVMFTKKNAQHWLKANIYIKDAIRYYSAWYGEYAYNNCTAVQGAISAGGAMEYPTITVVGEDYSDLVLESAVMHEVGHNWFYGMLGFNERDYPYLDEGFNTFSEIRYMHTKYGDKNNLYEMLMPEKIAKIFNVEDFSYFFYHDITALLAQRFNMDQPIMTPSINFDMLNYGSVIYSKAGISYYYLLHVLGETKFNGIMHSFFEEWKFKHPQPADFQKAFESATDMDLSWFFNDLLTTTKRLDYKVVRKKGDKVRVKNVGDIASPVSIKGFENDSVIAYDVIEPGFNKSKWINVPNDDVDHLIINHLEFPEYNRKNNYLKTNGLFKQIEPLEIYPFQIVEKPYKTQLGVLPSLGWNYYNQFMLGALLYNPKIPMQKVDYIFIPMYGFGNKNLAGQGRMILHTFMLDKAFERIDFSVSGLQYAYDNDKDANFNKVKGGIDFYIRKGYSLSPVRQIVSLSFVQLTSVDTLASGFTTSNNYFINGEYTLANKRKFNYYDIALRSEYTDDQFKANLELNYTLRIPGYDDDAIFIRGFAGYLYHTKDKKYWAYNISGVDGYSDYQYDDIYLGRFEMFGVDGANQFLSQQFIEKDGGFCAYSPLMADEWLVTLNTKIKLKNPFKDTEVSKTLAYIYSNVGTYSNAGNTSIYFDADKEVKTVSIPYDIGLDLSLFSGIIDIYFPIVMSNDIQKGLDYYTDNYFQTIRYSVNLDFEIHKLREIIRE
ncbi:MAG: M1 family metallopeptidase [Bacteroidales bacterium]|nr:M1 family metallopeptidase [Bacteroidales bacterium]